MNETKEFIIWRENNKEDLKKQYKDYLKNTVLADEHFEIEATEDFYTWCEVEFEKLIEDN